MSLSKNQHYVRRAIQLDSMTLDDNFVNIIISKILSAFDHSSFNLFRNELKLLLQLILWYCKTYQNNTTISFDIYKCHYQYPLSFGQKLSFILKFLIQYMQEYLDQYSNSLNNNKFIKFIGKFLLYYRVLDVLILYSFIYKGSNRNLHEKLFNIRIVGCNRQSNIHSSYSNNELLWNTMIEVLTLLIPFIMNTSFYSSINRRLNFESNSSTAKYSLENKPNHCKICHKPAVNAKSIANCKHVYCYFCLLNDFNLNQLFKCNDCNTSINSLHMLKNRF